MDAHWVNQQPPLGSAPQQVLCEARQRVECASARPQLCIRQCNDVVSESTCCKGQSLQLACAVCCHPHAKPARLPRPKPLRAAGAGTATVAVQFGTCRGGYHRARTQRRHAQRAAAPATYSASQPSTRAPPSSHTHRCPGTVCRRKTWGWRRQLRNGAWGRTAARLMWRSVLGCQASGASRGRQRRAPQPKHPAPDAPDRHKRSRR